ncbi:hypothetical protein BRARA_A00702 [Brassica rapa]|uniref:Uncharacterized protein n=1 Tax=Brassica campestris TaxID=3711 RepID=A0A398AJ90_BRACM|nr:hypothetical protein BRARA_A00702 [Brassica rapa]
MSKLVRLWRGIWNKDNDGAWNFHPDPTDFGFGAMIRQDETYEYLLGIVRARYVLGEGTPIVLSYQFPSWILGPLGRRSVPISVTTTADIPVMMSVREWFTELILVVTIGPESVARFHYNRRDNFVVGRKRFVVDSTQNAFTRREYERLVQGERMTCSRAILEELFNEEEMMVLHRVDLEMYMSDRVQEQAERRYEAVAREIIMIEDEDDTMADPHVSTEATPVATQGGVGHDHTEPIVGEECTLPLTQIAEAPQAPPTVPLDLTHVDRRHSMETPMAFWKGLYGDDLVLPGGVAPDREGENEDVEDDPCVPLGPDSGALAVTSLADNDISSTGSCEDLDIEPRATKTDAVEAHATSQTHVASAINNAVSAIDNAVSAIDTGNELLVAFEQFLASRGEGVQPVAEIGESSKSTLAGSTVPQTSKPVVAPVAPGLTIGCVGAAEPIPTVVADPDQHSSSGGSGDDGGF